MFSFQTIWLLIVFCFLFCVWQMRPKLSPTINSTWLPPLHAINNRVFSTWIRTTKFNDLHWEVLTALWRDVKDPTLITRTVDSVPETPTNEQLYKLLVTSYRLLKLFSSTTKLRALSLKLLPLIPKGWIWANYIVKCLNPTLEGIDTNGDLLEINTDDVDHSFFIRGQIGFEIETKTFRSDDRWGELVLNNPDRKFPEYLCYPRTTCQYKYQSLWQYNVPLMELDAFEIIPHLLSMQRKSGLIYTNWVCGRRMAGFYPQKVYVFEAKKQFNLPVSFTNLEDYKVFSRTVNGSKEICLFSFENGYRVQPATRTVKVVYGKLESGIVIDTTQSSDYVIFLNHRIYYKDFVPLTKNDRISLSDRQVIFKIGMMRFLINKLYAPIVVKN